MPILLNGVDVEKLQVIVNKNAETLNAFITQYNTMAVAFTLLQEKVNNLTTKPEEPASMDYAKLAMLLKDHGYVCYLKKNLEH